MAVDFLQLPGEEPEPANPPSKLLWSVVFALLFAGGVAATILLWPKSMPTNGWQFWTTIIVLPSALATFILTRRFSAYEASKLDVQAKNEVVTAYNKSVFDVASKPIAVLATAYRFSCDRKDNALTSILDKSMKLVSQVAIARDAAPINARWLVLPSVKLVRGTLAADKSRHLEGTRWLFAELIEEMSEAIKTLPQRVTLDVHFIMSSLLSIEDRDRLWNEQWQRFGLRQIDIAVGEDDVDLISLDRWLDRTIATPENKARLIVAIQMNVLQSASPPAGSAEAAAALLLMPQTTAARHTLVSKVALHRPVRAVIAQANDALQPALKWAGTDASYIKGGWQAGFDAISWGQVCTQDALLGVTKNVIKMDQSIGYAGVAAPWLAAACAAQSLSDDNPNQIVFVRAADTFDSAVLIRSAAKDGPPSTVHETSI
jgi:hypothetical protein